MWLEAKAILSGVAIIMISVVLVAIIFQSFLFGFLFTASSDSGRL